MPEIQTTFLDHQNVRHVKALTNNQRKIIALISCGLTQAEVARRLGFSRPYINQIIKKLQSLSLIKRVNTQDAPKGTRHYNYFYEVSPEAKIPDQPFTACRVHNIRKKFKILQQSGEIAVDQRAGWTRSWKPRGPARHKFWYHGKAGLPSVTIDVHPGMIVAYTDKGQFIPAKDIEQAKEISWYALMLARDKFIEQQERFGVHLGIETAGEDIAEIHYGFLFDDRSPIAQESTSLPEWWIDKSLSDKLGKHVKEIETKNKAEAFPLDNGIRSIQKLPDTVKASIQEAMPEAIKEFEKSFGPLTSEIHTVMAHIQGGEPIQHKVDQLIIMFSKVLEQQHEILARMNKEQ